MKIFINSKKYFKLIFCYLFLIVINFFLVSCSAKPLANAAAVDDQGKIIHLNDYRGKWIVLNYWASWCDNCLEEVPQLNAFYQKHANKDAVVLAVNFDQVNKLKLQQIVKKLNIHYPVLATDPGPQIGITNLPGVPISFLINPNGELVKTLYGQQTEQGLEKDMSLTSVK